MLDGGVARSDARAGFLRWLTVNVGTPASPAVRRASPYVTAGALSVIAAAMLTFSSSRQAGAGAVLVLALLFVLTAPPSAFIAGSVLFIGAEQIALRYSFSIGPGLVYGTDLFTLLVVLRGLLPKPRRAAYHIGAVGHVLITLWIVVMVIGVVRGQAAGAGLNTALRDGLALIYWPGLWFGFSRVMRERDFDAARAIRLSVFAAIGLIAYMLLMRAVNHPFESVTQVGRLGEVVAANGQVFHRDFGFASAYIIYPALALFALGQILYSNTRRFAWSVVAALGVLATLLSLIRAEIYGLAAGAGVMLVISRDVHVRSGEVIRSRRLRTAGVLALVLILFAVGLSAVSPSFANVVGERSLPGFSHQSTAADENAQYRLQALEAGLRVAREHTFGLGFISDQQVTAANVDPGYLAHSTPGFLLIYLGWPGLVAGVLALLGIFYESARAPSPAPWVHPVLVGTLTMMAVYGFGAAGLVSQEFVIGLGALLVAARFAAVDTRGP